MIAILILLTKNWLYLLCLPGQCREISTKVDESAYIARCLGKIGLGVQPRNRHPWELLRSFLWEPRRLFISHPRKLVEKDPLVPKSDSHEPLTNMLTGPLPSFENSFALDILLLHPLARNSFRIAFSSSCSICNSDALNEFLLIGILRWEEFEFSLSTIPSSFAKKISQLRPYWYFSGFSG